MITFFFSTHHTFWQTLITSLFQPWKLKHNTFFKYDLAFKGGIFNSNAKFTSHHPFWFQLFLCVMKTFEAFPSISSKSEKYFKFNFETIQNISSWIKLIVYLSLLWQRKQMWGSTNQLNIEYVKIRPSVYLILLLFIIEMLLSINEYNDWISWMILMKSIFKLINYYQINLVQWRLRFHNRNPINTSHYVSILLPINTETIVIRILDLLNPSSCEPVSIQWQIRSIKRKTCLSSKHDFS